MIPNVTLTQSKMNNQNMFSALCVFQIKLGCFSPYLSDWFLSLAFCSATIFPLCPTVNANVPWTCCGYRSLCMCFLNTSARSDATSSSNAIFISYKGKVTERLA